MPQKNGAAEKEVALAKGRGVLGGSRLGLAENGVLDFQYTRALGYAAYGAASVGEVAGVAREVRRRGGGRGAWIEAWASRGRRCRSLAEDALAAGKKETARSLFLRAYNYLRASEFYFERKNPVEHRALYYEGLSCFDRAVGLFGLPAEKVGIPYENNASMPGYFFKCSEGEEPRPTVIVCGGGDGHGEETYLIGGVPEALARGINALVFHGPGQRGLLHGHPHLAIRADYEVPVGRVVDFALSRADVDANRLAIYGLSFGGYIAPRAAAHDGRIKALVANAPIRDFNALLMALVPDALPRPLRPAARRLASGAPGWAWDALAARLSATDWVWEATIDSYFLWNNGVGTFSELVEKTKGYTLAGLEGEIRCPTLCLVGDGEPPAAREQTRRFHAALEAPKSYVTLSARDGSDAHCGIGNVPHTSAIAYDWLRETLRGEPGDAGSAAGWSKTAVARRTRGS